VRADLTRPVGERVVSVKVGDEPLDPAKTYSLVTNDFLARGGDGYESMTKANMLVDPQEASLIANHVMEYIKKKGVVAQDRRPRDHRPRASPRNRRGSNALTEQAKNPLLASSAGRMAALPALRIKAERKVRAPRKHGAG
jgi:hypothetical protein